MKKLLFLLLPALLVGIEGHSQANIKSGKSAGVKIIVYYFHFTARCVTCKTVESETKADLAVLYGTKVGFKAINLDEESGKKLAEKFKVSGQTLLVVKGSNQINLTNEAFLYARSNPSKFRTILKAKVDPLL